MTMFAVLLFALLPLMALIIHTGFITLTRRQMQIAVNTAAKEGLRTRDDLTPTETVRRERIRDLVSAVFDDNIDSDADDTLELGAGPVITFDDEPTDIPLSGTDFKASRTIRSSNLDVYNPDLALNISDARNGDMVRGQYNVSGNHEEASGSYERLDFRLTGDPEYVPARGNDAFLVRLRRSGETFTGGVGSAGPTIPYLFGRVPYGNADGGTSLLDQRERGTIVRATAIARARPVRTAGWDDGDVGSGLGPIVVTYSEWMGATPIPITNSHFVDNTGGPLSLGSLRPGAGVPTNLVSESRYIAVVDAGTTRVIGFGAGTLDFNSMTGVGTVTRLSSAVATGNTSAQLISLPSGLTQADWDAVFTAHRQFDIDSLSYDSDTEPLLAPALVRTIE